MTLTCKTSSPGSVSYKFFVNGSKNVYSGSSGGYVIPSTGGEQNTFTCKTIISGVTSAPSSAVNITFVGEFFMNI